MREKPKPFERYKHFKGDLYQIIALAKDSEDGHECVVYQALYGNYQVYVRSLEMFLSPVDSVKYPDTVQKYRFELTGNEQQDSDHTQKQDSENVQKQVMPAAKETEVPDLAPALLEYLDADTYEQRLNILASVKHSITDEMLTTMAIASDIELEPGPLMQRYESLKHCLITKDKFERVRLR